MVFENNAQHSKATILASDIEVRQGASSTMDNTHDRLLRLRRNNGIVLNSSILDELDKYFACDHWSWYLLVGETSAVKGGE